VAYDVEGFIAKREVLERHLFRYGWARVAPLKQGYGLVPIVERTWELVNERLAEAAGVRSDVRGDFFKLCWALADWLGDMSYDGPVAAIQVQCFGGDCEHAAAVWKDGRQTHGPAKMESIDRSFDNPVNQALRLIGVEVGDSYDAFVAIGLAEVRSSEDWWAEAY
jgi:hypothetical protein